MPSNHTPHTHPTVSRSAQNTTVQNTTVWLIILAIVIIAGVSYALYERNYTLPPNTNYGNSTAPGDDTSSSSTSNDAAPGDTTSGSTATTNPVSHATIPEKMMPGAQGTGTQATNPASSQNSAQ